jgi:hypothetical protein
MSKHYHPLRRVAAAGVAAGVVEAAVTSAPPVEVVVLVA